MRKNNYFVEGLQGAGKSAFVQRLSEHFPDYEVFREGDFSPVELAWCAYATEEQYDDILAEYPSLHAELKENTFTEGTHKIIRYTRILTDIPHFHKNMEKYEIYNGNLDEENFGRLILERFQKWNARGQIFECSLFQNIIENQMLYFLMAEEDIMDFYRKLKHILSGKPYKIIYLDVENIPDAIHVIRKERSDADGTELWFPMMLQYLKESPYGKKYALSGPEGLLAHLEKRKALEHRIINDIFRENTLILKAKGYTPDDISALERA